MNRLETNLSLKGEAKLKYASGEYQIISPGDFVRCAVTGVPIPLDDLRYWNFELQEAYANAATALQRQRETASRGEVQDTAR